MARSAKKCEKDEKTEKVKLKKVRKCRLVIVIKPLTWCDGFVSGSSERQH